MSVLKFCQGDKCVNVPGVYHMSLEAPAPSTMCTVHIVVSGQKTYKSGACYLHFKFARLMITKTKNVTLKD